MSERRRPLKARALSAAQIFLAAAWSLGLGCGAATAQNQRPAYLPLTFHTETQAIRTAACLQVVERVYPQSAWWEEPGGKDAPAERAFKAVIEAIRRKDRAALLRVTDPAQGRDTRRFDEQAGAFFHQFGVVELLSVPRAYEFDGLAVFFARFRARGQTFSAPFAFAQGADASFKFLPFRTEQLTFLLVEDWFDAAWGPGTTDTPKYCAEGEVKRATHRVPLLAPPAAARQVRAPSHLLLAGAALDAPGELAGLKARIKSKHEELKSAPARGPDELLKHMTAEGGNRLKEWFASAGEAERSRYQSEMKDQRAFFVVDASPLFVVYARSAAGAVQTFYFTLGANNELLWTNSSHVTAADDVFKRGPVYDAFVSDKPSANSAVK